jgi:hypothetical protein
MLCRKNQATLTASEKARFVAAALALKADGTWDRFVAIHDGAHMSAHRGPAFFPWHREYLRRLELELQRIDSSVTIPYWNWSVDSSPTSSLWNPDFLGGDGRPGDGRVMTGPFAFDAGQWTLVHGSDQDLRRQLGRNVPTLPSLADVTATRAAVPYDVFPWNTSSPSGFRNQAEGWIAGPQMHNRVHVWVGGSMLPLTSPNDPVFFLHHCFVDKLWAAWQKDHPTEGYLPASGAATGHNLHDPMEPWASAGEIVRPSTVLDHHALGYAYDDEPECAGKSLPKIEKIEIKEGKLEKLEFKEFKREKLEKPERKELLKREKPERKEVKQEKLEKPERKELKQEKFEKFEKLENLENKDLALEKPPELEGKDLVAEKPPALEGKDLVEGGKNFDEGGPLGPGIDVATPVQPDLADTVRRLEATMRDLRHFIDTALRPDLTGGALGHEPDAGAGQPDDGEPGDHHDHDH